MNIYLKKAIKARNLLIWFGLAISSVLFFIGCDGSPSSYYAENVLRNNVESESEGRIKLVRFTKKDGQLSEVRGVKHYMLNYEAEFEYQGDHLIQTGEIRGEKWDSGWKLYVEDLSLSKWYCIRSLREIDAAKQKWALDKNKTDADTPTWDELKPYLKNAALPQCPAKGTYHIKRVNEEPRCSIRDHRLPEP